MNLCNYMKRFTWFLIIMLFLICYAFEKGYVFYLNKYIQFNSVLLCMIIVIPVLLFFFMIPLEALMAHLGIILLGVFLFVTMSFKYGIVDEYHFTEISSPDQSHELVFYERKNMLQCDGLIGEKSTFFFIKKRGSYSTDFLFPVHDGNFSIEWKKKSYIFTYKCISGEITLEDGQRESNMKHIEIAYINGTK